VEKKWVAFSVPHDGEWQLAHRENSNEAVGSVHLESWASETESALLRAARYLADVVMVSK